MFDEWLVRSRPSGVQSTRTVRRNRRRRVGRAGEGLIDSTPSLTRDDIKPPRRIDRKPGRPVLIHSFDVICDNIDAVGPDHQRNRWRCDARMMHTAAAKSWRRWSTRQKLLLHAAQNTPVLIRSGIGSDRRCRPNVYDSSSPGGCSWNGRVNVSSSRSHQVYYSVTVTLENTDQQVLFRGSEQ